MIDATGGASAGAVARTSAGPGGKLGRDEFMQLLVAQLRHQDPLDPSSPEEFASQLAQFSSLEQLVGMNEKLAESGETEALMARAANRSTAASLIGRHALAPGNTVDIDGSGSETVTVFVGEGGGSATLHLLDDFGNPVARAELGTVAGGRREIPVGSIFPEVPSGSYRYEMDVRGDGGGEVAVETFSRHRISGIRFSPDGVVLLSGERGIPLGEVLEVVSEP